MTEMDFIAHEKRPIEMFHAVVHTVDWSGT